MSKRQSNCAKAIVNHDQPELYNDAKSLRYFFLFLFFLSFFFWYLRVWILEALLTWRSRAFECKFCETWYLSASLRCLPSSPWLRGVVTRSIEAVPAKKSEKIRRRSSRTTSRLRRSNSKEQGECNFLASHGNSWSRPRILRVNIPWDCQIITIFSLQFSIFNSCLNISISGIVGRAIGEIKNYKYERQKIFFLKYCTLCVHHNVIYVILIASY